MSTYIVTRTFVALELFDVAHVNFVTGIFQIFTGLGAYLGPNLASYVYKVPGKNLPWALNTTGGLYGLGMIFSGLCWILHRKVENKRKNTSSTVAHTVGKLRKISGMIIDHI